MKRICDDNLKCQPGFDCNSFFADTCLILTPHYYGQIALSLGKQSLYIFSYFNLIKYGHFLWLPQCPCKRRLTFGSLL